MATISCSRCGAPGDRGDGVPLGWSTATSADESTALCPTCTRDHVRAIEAKLDDAWWTDP